MKHSNVAIFVPHNGCPHQCSFCNQRCITGQAYQPQAQDVISAINTAIDSLGKDTEYSEVAFFGGSFTAIDRGYMLSLLDATKPYIDRFKGIRISTRPDYINQEILDILKSYKISSIELGVQSMSDDVLLANKRGHTSRDVYVASQLIKDNNIELGLQMMTNLYKSTIADDLYTAECFTHIKPKTVRIYPTIVLRGTELFDLYQGGLHTAYTLEQSVDECAKLIKIFEKNGINVIRVGLHSGGNVDDSYVAGAYHQAFRELCHSKIMIKEILDYLKNNQFNRDIDIFVAPKNISATIGQKRGNIAVLQQNGYNAKVLPSDALTGRAFIIKSR